MNEDIAHKSICLKLNSNWLPIGYGLVADAIVDLVAGESVKALNIEYVMDENGNPDFNGRPDMYPLTWEEWIMLPIRPWDLVIRSTKLTVRVPTVLIAKNFSKMPMKEWRGKPSSEAIYIRDNGTCQYTGKKLTRKDATVDHMIPKSRGGSDDWTNLVLASKEFNSKKGNSLNSEIGAKVMKLPLKPRPIPVSHLIREARHQDWELFIKQR